MTRTRLSLTVSLLAALTAMTVLLSLPGAGTYALWQASLPLTGTVTTGGLALNDDVITGGTWTRGAAPFDPEADFLTPGDVLTYTVEVVSVTAVGENLRATFQDVTGADIPDDIELSIDSTPSPVHGAEPGGDPRTVDLILTVTASSDMPTGTQTIDLSTLTVTFGNGAGWTDTAVLDAGTLSTTSTTYPPVEGKGTVHLEFKAASAGEVAGFYLQGPSDDTIINWGNVQVPAKTGLNTSPPGANLNYVLIKGPFYGIGDCSEDQSSYIRSLTYVGGFKDTGTVDASCAFKDAVNLEQVNVLPDTLTTTKSMLEGTSELEYIGIQSWDSSGVTDMSSMFRNSGYEGMNTQLNTSSVRDMSYMFAGATKFKGPANFSGAEKVTTMKGMFQGATSYSGDVWFDVGTTRVDAPSLTDMSHMFEDAPNFNGPLYMWDIPNVATMDRMLWGATGFTQDLTDWNVDSVTSWTDFAHAGGLPQNNWPLRFRPSAEATDVVAEAGDVEPPGDEVPGEDTPESELPLDSETDAATEPADEAPTKAAEDTCADSASDLAAEPEPAAAAPEEVQPTPELDPTQDAEDPGEEPTACDPETPTAGPVAEERPADATDQTTTRKESDDEH